MNAQQQAAIQRAMQKMEASGASAPVGSLNERQMEAINRAMGRAGSSMTFASPVIDPRFYQAGEVAEDISTQPSINEVNPFALSEGGINIGTPESRQMAGRLATRGMTLGLSEPAIAGIQSAMTGTPFSDQFSQNQADMRFYEEQVGPVASLGTEIAGGVATPFSLLRMPERFQKMGVGAQAAIKSGVAGGIYGASTEEGGFAERGQRALEVAIPSALFGVATEKVIAPVATKTLAALTRQNAKAPTLETLKQQRDLAYKQADEVENLFGLNDYDRFIANASNRIRDMGYDPDSDIQVRAAIKYLTEKQGQVMTLKEMDKARQTLWRRHKNGTGGEKEIIREIIDEMDELIESTLGASQNEALLAARVSHKQYKKAEVLDESFENAKLQAAATGSGGNIENLYRQAVLRILRSKDARFFSPEEKEVMERFVRGDFTQNIARLFGKLSPSGNGLMMALNLGAVATDPTFVLATMAGASSKAFADKRIQNEAQKIIEMMGLDANTITRPLGTGGTSATISGQATEQDER